MNAKHSRARAAAFDPAPRLTAALLIGVLALTVLALVRPMHGSPQESFDVATHR